MRRRTAPLAVTNAENGYDYAGQDPVNAYDLDGTVLDKNGIGDCEIGSCGNTFPGNTTGIAPAGKILEGSAELAVVGLCAFEDAEAACNTAANVLLGYNVTKDVYRGYKTGNWTAAVEDVGTDVAFYGLGKISDRAVRGIAVDLQSAVGRRDIIAIASPAEWILEQVLRRSLVRR